MKKLSDYPNIGKKTEKQLAAVEIYTIEELKKLGAEQAWLKNQRNRSFCLFASIISFRRCYSRS
ncbi:TfoX/Sxy family DNA transformation protein [Enterococcus faecium]